MAATIIAAFIASGMASESAEHNTCNETTQPKKAENGSIQPGSDSLHKGIRLVWQSDGRFTLTSKHLEDASELTLLFVKLEKESDDDTETGSELDSDGETWEDSYFESEVIGEFDINTGKSDQRYNGSPPCQCA